MKDAIEANRAQHVIEHLKSTINQYKESVEKAKKKYGVREVIMPVEETKDNETKEQKVEEAKEQKVEVAEQKNVEVVEQPKEAEVAEEQKVEQPKEVEVAEQPKEAEPKEEEKQATQRKKSPYDGITGEQMMALPPDEKVKAWEFMVEKIEEKLKIAIDKKQGQKVVEHYQKLVEEGKECLERLKLEHERSLENEIDDELEREDEMAMMYSDDEDSDRYDY